MTDKKGRALYQPPCSINLSEWSVQGQVSPEGNCSNGPNPYYNCVDGPQFIGACSSGTTPDTSDCVAGLYHTAPTCASGGTAATICYTGSGQQW